MKYQSFHDFWPFYLQEHSKKGTKILHFIGTTLLFPFLGMAIFYSSVTFLFSAIICAYGCAWIGHFFIEKNKPATFQYPLYSLLGDFKMYGMMWMGLFLTKTPGTQS